MEYGAAIMPPAQMLLKSISSSIILSLPLQQQQVSISGSQSGQLRSIITSRVSERDGRPYIII